MGKKETHVVSVADDGSFGNTLTSLDGPTHAAAIGNNGENILINASFDSTEPFLRKIIFGVRCSDCGNLSGLGVPTAIRTLKLLAGEEPEIPLTFDANNDGMVGLAEAIFHLQVAAGLRTAGIE